MRTTTGLAIGESEGNRIAHAMGNADILFLKNHGVMVAGASIAEAWDDLYYLERATEVQLRAMASNRPFKPVPYERDRATLLRADARRRCAERTGTSDKRHAAVEGARDRVRGMKRMPVLTCARSVI